MLTEKIKVIKYEPCFKKDNYSRMARFDCGNDDINTIFRKKTDKLHTTTYLFIDKDTDKIISFTAFCASSIQIRRKKKGLFSFPAIELKLFGVDKEYQHKTVKIQNEDLKYSEFVFQWFVSYIQQVIKPVVNVEYLILHSVTSNNTIKFYEKMGLEPLSEQENVHNSDFSDGCIPMYLKI